jgi:hypothetical protein
MFVAPSVLKERVDEGTDVALNRNKAGGLAEALASLTLRRRSKRRHVPEPSVRGQWRFMR